MAVEFMSRKEKGWGVREGKRGKLLRGPSHEEPWQNVLDSPLLLAGTWQGRRGTRPIQGLLGDAPLLRGLVHSLTLSMGGAGEQGRSLVLGCCEASEVPRATRQPSALGHFHTLDRDSHCPTAVCVRVCT